MAQEAKDYDFSVLRELRADRKITLEKLAEATGISFSTLARIESNANQPNLATLKKLADFFGMTPANMLELATAYIVQEVEETLDILNPVRRRKIDYPGLSLVYAQGKAGQRAHQSHRHEEEYQVTWVLHGQMSIDIHGKKIELTNGQSIKFDAAFEHKTHFVADTVYVVALMPKRTR
ncbi:MAG: helix-turn-helix domain-containing protein [Candidatus Lernaella stagnicola]|nr:helix-turn-helix domain-containing protein [Candidatus Lernaella stagnicola]